MKGENNLNTLIKNMTPHLNDGSYVFNSVQSLEGIIEKDIIMMFREGEGYTLILEKHIADQKGLAYDFIASWITLRVHSALSAVGLTAAFSAALAESNISCNVVAGYHHDHIFVDEKDGQTAIQVLQNLSSKAF
jgi:uncharacterized protein